MNIRDKFKSFFFDYWPDYIYIKLLPLLLPLFNSKRTAHGYKVSSLGNNLFNIYNVSDSLFFIGAKRIDRWLYPNGINKGCQRMIEKYLPENLHIKENDIVVEVGANIGEFTLAMLKMEAAIYSFEPDAAVYKCLIRNVSAYSNIKTFPVACSNHDGKVQFYISSNDADSSVIKPEVFTEVVTVDCLTLATINSQIVNGVIKLLKVEAEGYEPEVLATLHFCADKIMNITVDAGPERLGSSTKDEVSSILMINGYSVSCKGDIVFGSKEGISF
jgi:FkbM family methyltransferase